MQGTTTEGVSDVVIVNARAHTAAAIEGPYADALDGPVSLCMAALDDPRWSACELFPLLSSAERERAERCLRVSARRRFVIARATLRALLAARAGCGPAELEIVTDDRGKPRLAQSELGFSTSRSEDVALHAIGRGAELGVDVEAIRADTDIERVGARFFTAGEREALAALPAAQRLASAFQCWARKEAFAKGTGAGLSGELAAVDVGIGGESSVTGGWSIHELSVAGGFAAALAIRASAGERLPAPELIHLADPQERLQRAVRPIYEADAF